MQIGVGTADNTGSEVNFVAANMKHVNGLAVVNLNGKTVPQTYYYDGNTGKASSVRAASTTTATVWPSVKFNSSTRPFSISNTSSLKRYLAIIKPSTATTISTTATSGCEAWSLSYNVSKNTSLSQSVTSSRPGYYLGWVYSYKGAVETFTAPENANYKLEVWGAQGTNLSTDGRAGLGGYSYGSIQLSANNSLFIAVGQTYIWSGQNTPDNTYPSNFNNRNDNTPKLFYAGVPGGGATHIATSNHGELAYYYVDANHDYRNDVLLVAGGGGSNELSNFVIANGKGGDGGGLIGVNGSHGTGGSQSTGGTTVLCYQTYTSSTNGAFGVGGYGHSNGDYGAQGGGGWYGGGGAFDVGCGGGGSGYVNFRISGQTIAGNTSFTSPSGGTETGHTGNGCAIITQTAF